MTASMVISPIRSCFIVVSLPFSRQRNGRGQYRQAAPELWRHAFRLLLRSAANRRKSCLAEERLQHRSPNAARATAATLTPQSRSFLSGARDIFGVAAAKQMRAFRRQLQHAVGKRREKMPVMRDEQHGA